MLFRNSYIDAYLASANVIAKEIRLRKVSIKAVYILSSSKSPSLSHARSWSGSGSRPIKVQVQQRDQNSKQQGAIKFIIH